MSDEKKAKKLISSFVCEKDKDIENFFTAMKQEMYYGKIYKNYDQLEKAITNYITYYNEKRIKEKLN